MASVARRGMGVPPGRPSRPGTRGGRACGWLAGGRGAEPLDDARRRVSALHERRDAVRHAAPARARAQSDGALPPRVHPAARMGQAPCRAAFRRRRRGAPRGRQRTAGGARQGRANPCRVRRHRPRRPRGVEQVLAAVVRWSDASFVEDQDQWWHAGISREVLLYTTGTTHIADVFARGELGRRLPGRDARGRREGGRPGRRRLVGRGAPARSAGQDGPGGAARSRRGRPHAAPAGPRATPLVGRGPRPLHAGRQPSKPREQRERRVPRRLPPRRDARWAPARQREGRFGSTASTATSTTTREAGRSRAS